MIRDSSFEGAGLVIFDVKGESSFQELDGEVILADCVKNEANVAVDQGNFGMVLTDHHQGKIPSAVQQFQCGAERVNKLKLNKASMKSCNFEHLLLLKTSFGLFLEVPQR